MTDPRGGVGNERGGAITGGGHRSDQKREGLGAKAGAEVIVGEVEPRLGVALEKGYRDYGYEVVRVPVMSVKDRIEFILANLD